jgi:predicted transcriptional regulator
MAISIKFDDHDSPRLPTAVRAIVERARDMGLTRQMIADRTDIPLSTIHKMFQGGQAWSNWERWQRIIDVIGSGNEQQEDA